MQVRTFYTLNFDLNSLFDGKVEAEALKCNYGIFSRNFVLECPVSSFLHPKIALKNPH